MLIRVLQQIAGAGYIYWPGDQINVPEDEARRFVVSGYAEPIISDTRGDCSMVAPPATAPRPKPKRRFR